MASTFELEIVTPDKQFFKGLVEQIVVRTTQGDMGVLKNHIPTVSPLQIGVLRIKQNGQYKEATCAGGLIQVKKDKTIILTDAAEWPEEIDEKRAQESFKKAKERLENSSEEIDKKRAEKSLKRAEIRLRLLQKS
ncbi:ATP synthase F1 subunit epsilon [Anaerophilus nitritogenes]|uniref:ATP synthase F1 subunit epsilon n=1 Tax=Anaerophilus nitritogenes TaxID=2498136 RepID=UPI00101BBC79|nr:ATP synthase F1 subunit epsilon [Anaerophilus nitritogenes]